LVDIDDERLAAGEGVFIRWIPESVAVGHSIPILLDEALAVLDAAVERIAIRPLTPAAFGFPPLLADDRMLFLYRCHLFLL